MELNSLKAGWQNAGKGKKNQAEILMMTRIKNHPGIKKIRIRLVIEMIALSTFLALFYSGFDGATKPLWANALLIAVSLALIIVRGMGLLVIRNPVDRKNVKTSLLVFRKRLERIATLTSLTALLFGAGLIAFFSSSISFTREKYITLAVLILILLLLVYLSGLQWRKKIKSINNLLTEFEEHADDLTDQ